MTGKVFAETYLGQIVINKKKDLDPEDRENDAFPYRLTDKKGKVIGYIKGAANHVLVELDGPHGWCEGSCTPEDWKSIILLRHSSHIWSVPLDLIQIAEAGD